MSKIKEIIIDSLKESECDYSKDSLDNQTPIFGGKGKLDSLGLVTFLVAVEQKIEDEYTTSITIADEKAMSHKHSPFKTINSLADYIFTLLKSN